MRSADNLRHGRTKVNGHPPLHPRHAVIKVFGFRLADRPGRLHFVFSSADARLKDLPIAMEGDLGTVDLHSDVAAWVEGQLNRILSFRSTLGREHAPTSILALVEGHSGGHRRLPSFQHVVDSRLGHFVLVRCRV
jgi:hypothetical protein